MPRLRTQKNVVRIASRLIAGELASGKEKGRYLDGHGGLDTKAAIRDVLQLCDDAAAAIPQEAEDERRETREKLLALPITALNLPLKPFRCLLSAEIGTLGDLVKCSESDLVRIKNLGQIALTQIKEALAEKGLRLSGPTIDEVMAAKRSIKA